MDESRCTHEWFMPKIWMSHGAHGWYTYEWVMTQRACLLHNKSCHTNEWVMSHAWMSHVACMNEVCHKQEWVMAHTWKSYYILNESWHAEPASCIMSHITHVNESHGTQMEESHHTYEWVKTRTWISPATHIYASWHAEPSSCPKGHATHMNESYHTREWVTLYIWMRHVTYPSNTPLFCVYVCVYMHILWEQISYRSIFMLRTEVRMCLGRYMRTLVRSINMLR